MSNERKTQLDDARKRAGKQPNAHEIFNRAKKTARLLRTIDQHVYDSLSDAPDAQWHEIAMVAGVNPPSRETIRHVLVRLRERLEAHDRSE